MSYKINLPQVAAAHPDPLRQTPFVRHNFLCPYWHSFHIKSHMLRAGPSGPRREVGSNHQNPGKRNQKLMAVI